MRFFRPISAALFFGLLASTSGQVDIPKTDVDRMLAELEELTETAQERKTGKHAAAMKAFASAAGSDSAAYDLFLECVKLVNFDQRERRFSEYRDWKSRMKELRSAEHCTVLRMQLQWLVLAIRADNTEDFEEMLPDIYQYIDAVAKNLPAMGRHASKFDQSVTSTISAKAYGLDTALNLRNWEFNPADLEGIFAKSVFPFYLAMEDVKPLAAAWDRLIKLETDRAAKAELEQTKKEFINVDLPRLKWKKWRDVFKAGGEEEAAKALLSIIRTNVGHDDAESWIAELRGFLELGAPE